MPYHYYLFLYRKKKLASPLHVGSNVSACGNVPILNHRMIFYLPRTRNDENDLPAADFIPGWNVAQGWFCKLLKSDRQKKKKKRKIGRPFSGRDVKFLCGFGDKSA